MWLVNFALRRPITVLVLVLALALSAWLAVRRMRIDIFPSLGAPAIYVAQPYGGMDPSQMEGFLTYYYEYHFLYITGIEHVESKSIQGVALMKLVFHPDTDMSQALSETVAQVNRSRAFMPPGAVPPFIVRFDAGSVAIGQLVFSSPNRSPGEMQDIAINRVRPLFATLPGVSAPPPFGGNQRTIVVRVEPQKMRQYSLSPEEIVQAVNRASVVLPSGNLRIGDRTYITSTNAVIGGDFRELMEAPVRTGSGPAVYIRDIGIVENGADIVTGYAHVNGKRTVYIPVTKRSDASTLAVIQRVRQALPAMRAVVPEDVEVRLEFDQSGYVVRALRTLVSEGLIGALLTGLMVVLFLRDWRSALIVVATIPVSLLGAITGLWAAGQTINIMTLAGLALAVGVLVDESTVEIENIHTHMVSGLARSRAVLAACGRTALPRLLSMLCMLAVFVPAFFMTGVARQLFIPLSLAVGFAVLASYLLSSTLVPVLSTWLMKQARPEEEHRGLLYRLYEKYVAFVIRLRWPLAGLYLASALGGLYFLAPRLGVELFPSVDAGQFQLRLRAPTGTRIERTEVLALRVLDLIEETVGKGNLAISTAFIGVQPASYPINTIHLWTSGPHEAVLQAALTPSAAVRGEDLKERLRTRIAAGMPELAVSFEPGDIVGKVMSFGSPATIEVAAQGPSLAANRGHAARLHAELARLPFLRDLHYAQPLDYPAIDVSIDRGRAGQLGLTAADVARSLVVATSSSRFIDPNYWRDPASGNAFQIQVEIPQFLMKSVEDVRAIPLRAGASGGPLLGDVATLKESRSFGLVERYNMQRVVSMTANVHGVPLGAAAAEVRAALKRAGEPPRGVSVDVRGQIPPLEQTVAGLGTGLLLTIAVVFLLLAANFQSFRLALSILLTVPAVLLGVVLALMTTGATLNIQSFIGAIMAVGIAVANSILLVTFAEAGRRAGALVQDAARAGAVGRLRAILMTAAAMTFGMLPIALGFGEGAEQTTPLGRAVIGGLLLGTFATLTILPALYAVLQRDKGRFSASLHPADPESRYYEAH